MQARIISTPLSHVRPGLDRPLPAWQTAIKRAIRDVHELCTMLELPNSYLDEVLSTQGDFPLLVPREYVQRMEKGNPHDPLLRQVLPLRSELEPAPGFSPDPNDEQAAHVAPGLLQKYPGRALLVTTGACAVHCRYCFRRHFPYAETPKSIDAWRPALDALRQDASIREIILSGGDPLMLVDRTLAELVQELASIEHLRRLRVHTRLPIVIPQRVCGELLDWLTGTRLTPYMVVHANHKRELDDAVAAAVQQLAGCGVTVLNQAVLLADVNDSVDDQAELCEKLVDLGVLPYYLHRLDRVAGAAHFDVNVATGRRIVKVLRERLPGYAVPRFVEEIPGEPGKVSLV